MEQENAEKISIEAGVPNYYRKAEIKYSKFGVEDFDFGFYNKTKFGGLENDIQNSYCNSMIQLMFFIWPLREFARGHIRSSCLREPCLMCELGFIFRILESSKGVNCQASNFLRALSQIKQVTALGLIEPENITAESNISYGRLIQTFCRFFLEQIHQDAILTSHIYEGDKIIQQLFSIPLRSVSQCPESHRLEREISPFLIDLSYPKEISTKSQSNSFTQILEKSINKEIVTRAWCAECGKYQMTTQKKCLLKYPNFIFLNANIVSELELNLWINENSKTPWLPEKFTVDLKNDKLVIVDSRDPKYDETNLPVYELRASVAEIKISKGPGHLVTHANVSTDPKSPDWHFFNDFCALTLPEEHRIFQKWKVMIFNRFLP